MKFIMTIDSENEAVVDAPTFEVCRALRRVILRLEDEGAHHSNGGSLLDSNGNKIGSWSVEP